METAQVQPGPTTPREQSVPSKEERRGKKERKRQDRRGGLTVEISGVEFRIRSQKSFIATYVTHGGICLGDWCHTRIK